MTNPLRVGVVVLDLSESVSTLLVDRLLERFRVDWVLSLWVVPFCLAFERIRSRKLPCGLATPVSVTN